MRTNFAAPGLAPVLPGPGLRDLEPGTVLDVIATPYCGALYYKGILIATKGGLVRHGPGKYMPVGRPEYLRQCVLMSLRRLGLERIDL
jgi:hypothetical protein